MDTTEIPTDRTRMAWEYEGFTLQVWRPVHVDTWLTGFIQVIGDTDYKRPHFLESVVTTRITGVDALMPLDIRPTERERRYHQVRLEVCPARQWSARVPYVGPVNDMTLCVLRMTWIVDQLADPEKARGLAGGISQLAVRERELDWEAL